jgi:uncharacterized protein (DUF58 family)
MRLNPFRRQAEPAKKASLSLFEEGFLHRLERLNFRTAPSLRGVMVGEQRSRILRPALDFSDHRPYSTGDDLRHVDWNAYARHEELFVKLGESTQGIDLHILLDYSRSMTWEPGWQPTDYRLNHPSSHPATHPANQPPPPPITKWASARRLGGALAYLGLSGGERLIITPFAHELGQSFGPTHGKRRAIPALQFLSSLAPAPAPAQPVDSGLVHCLTAYAQSHPRGGLLILISDLLDAVSSIDPGQGAVWLAEGLRQLTPPRWQVVVMHLLTGQEADPWVEGDFDFKDMETGDSLPFRLDESTLGQYRLRLRRWYGELHSACTRRGATYARVLAEWPIERSVIPYLRQRGIVQ